MLDREGHGLGAISNGWEELKTDILLRKSLGRSVYNNRGSMAVVLFEILLNLEITVTKVWNFGICRSIPRFSSFLLRGRAFFHLHMLYIRVGDDGIWPLVPQPRQLSTHRFVDRDMSPSVCLGDTLPLVGNWPLPPENVP